MNATMFKWINRLLNDKPGDISSVRQSSTGIEVIKRYQCGHQHHNKLVFTANEKNTLRSRVKQELNIDPFVTEHLPETRLEVAKFHDNEKLATKPVSQDHLLINCPTGIIKINQQTINLHADIITSAGLMIINSGLTDIAHTAIVVVENLSIMQYCSQWSLPEPCRDALWLYRGDHKTGAKLEACHRFFKQFGEQKDIIICSDMDPKGLEIALTFPHAKYWLGPAQTSWTDCFSSCVASKEGYDKQDKAMKYLVHKSASGLLSQFMQNLIKQMQQHRSSYRQEHMLAQHIPLSLFPLWPDNETT